MRSVSALRLLIAQTVVCLIAIFVPIEGRAGNLVFDRSGNLFFEGRNTGTIFKYAPDGTKTTFATGTKVNLDQDLEVSDSESIEAQIFWAPDSKRFAFNYSPVHAHHMQFETVSFTS